MSGRCDGAPSSLRPGIGSSCSLIPRWFATGVSTHASVRSDHRGSSRTRRTCLAGPVLVPCREARDQPPVEPETIVWRALVACPLFILGVGGFGATLALVGCRTHGKHWAGLPGN